MAAQLPQIGPSIANAALGYDPSSQRFNPLSPAFSSQASALSLSPLLPQTVPVAGNFQYDYTQQITFGMEHQLGTNLSLAADYSYIHGLHLLRPRNINQGNFQPHYELCPRLDGLPQLAGRVSQRLRQSDLSGGRRQFGRFVG